MILVQCGNICIKSGYLRNSPVAAVDSCGNQRILINCLDTTDSCHQMYVDYFVIDFFDVVSVVVIID